MPRLIMKLTDAGKDYYLVWSTIVDAPITDGMPLEEFKEWYKFEYGRASLTRELPDQMNLVEANGVSARAETLNEVLSCNRAGPDEEKLTKDQIIEKYIRNRGKK